MAAPALPRRLPRWRPTTDTRYAPGERIPGLNVGGWFDAGDDDIRTVPQAATVMHLVDTWELFRPQRDETFVDQATRYVDLHRPDGRPDLLQQIEQGALGLVAQHRAFGRAIQTIIAPRLHQYHHLGDWSTQTDGLPYDPVLEPYESNGKASGTPDDRWAFTEKSAATNYVSSAALAAASRALRGYDDALAAECLAAARKAWSDEHAAEATETGRQATLRRGAEMGSTLQLLMATREKPYADRFQELVCPALEAAAGFTLAAAVRAIPFFGPEYKERLVPYVRKYRSEIDGQYEQNPYGVPITRVRLGRQRDDHPLGLDELPRPQGVPRDRRPRGGPGRPHLHPRPPPGVEPVLRLGRGHPLQAGRLRPEPGRVHLHRRWGGAGSPGAQARLAPRGWCRC